MQHDDNEINKIYQLINNEILWIKDEFINMMNDYKLMINKYGLWLLIYNNSNNSYS